MRTLILTFLIFLFAVSSAQSQSNLRIGIPDHPDQPTSVFIGAFINSKTLLSNDISVETLPLEALAKPSEYISLLQEGVYDFAFLPTSLIAESSSDALPHARLLDLPLLFAGVDERLRSQDSIYGEVVLAEVGRTGVLPLAFWNRLPSHLISKTQIASLNELKGMKIATADRLASEVLQQFGASAINRPIAMAEVFTAMEKGAYETTEVSPSSNTSPEAIASLADSGVADFRATAGFFATHVDQWSTLSETERSAVREAIAEADAAVREILQQSETTYLNSLDQAGVKLVRVSSFGEADREEIGKAVRKAWQDISGAEGTEALQLFDRVMSSSTEGPNDERGAVQSPESTTGTIHFATDRVKSGSSSFSRSFGARPQATQSINVACGEVGYKWESRRKTGAKYKGAISLVGSMNEGYDTCAQSLSPAIKAAGGHLIIFVHGYKNTFENSLRRAIAVRTDIGNNNLMLVWSWPSLGDTGGYLYDTESITWTDPQFEKFIKTLIELGEAKKIDLVTHSMGGRLGVLALEIFESERQRLRNVVFVAPDVPRSTFAQRTSLHAGVGALKTLYATKADRALQISTALNREYRAGSGGENILVVDAVESIDASAVEASFWRIFATNHAHAFEVPEAVSDLKTLLSTGKIARERDLDEFSSGQAVYWSIRPDPD